MFVDIPRGASTGAIARMLAEAGVVRSPWDFLLARVARRGRTLQAGEYRFERPASALEVLGRIARGDVSTTIWWRPRAGTCSTRGR